LTMLEETERIGAATPHTRAQAGLALTRLGRPDEAWAQARGALEPALKAEWTVGMCALTDGLAAWTFARCGARAEAEELVRAILCLPTRHHFPAGVGVG